MTPQGLLARFRDLAVLLDKSEFNRDPRIWLECEEIEEKLEEAMFQHAPFEAAPTPLEAIMMLPRREALPALTVLSTTQILGEPALVGFLFKCIVSKTGPSGVHDTALKKIPEDIICLACEFVQVANTGTYARHHWLKFLSGVVRIHLRCAVILRSYFTFANFVPRQLSDPNLEAGLHFMHTWLAIDTLALPDFVANEGHLCALFMLGAARTIASKDQAASLLGNTLSQLAPFPLNSVMSELVTHGLTETLRRTPDTPNVMSLVAKVIQSSVKARDQLIETGIVPRLLASLELFEGHALQALGTLALTRGAVLPPALDELIMTRTGPQASRALRALAVDPRVAARVVRKSRKNIDLL